MIKEFRVVIKEGNKSVSSFSIEYALSDAGIDVEYVELQACGEEDEEEGDD